MFSGSLAMAEAWRAQLRAHPHDMDVLENAVGFFTFANRQTAHDLMDRAESAEPRNARWPLKHAHLYDLDSDNGKNPTAAAKSLEKLERAMALDPSLRSNHIEELAEAALYANQPDKARVAAHEALAMVASQPKNWNNGNIIHHAHLVLGQVALRSGDSTAAKTHLLEAGKTSGSPQLNSFGPNMQLALDLLQKGEQQVVLDYLDLCENFWTRGQDKLDAWRTQIAEGKTPDFGANLNY
jgi:hypothetical protein